MKNVFGAIEVASFGGFKNAFNVHAPNLYSCNAYKRFIVKIPLEI